MVSERQTADRQTATNTTPRKIDHSELRENSGNYEESIFGSEFETGTEGCAKYAKSLQQLNSQYYKEHTDNKKSPFSSNSFSSNFCSSCNCCSNSAQGDLRQLINSCGQSFCWENDRQLKLNCEKSVITVPTVHEIQRKEKMVEIPQVNLVNAILPKIYNQGVSHDIPQLQIKVHSKEIELHKVKYVNKDVVVPLVEGYVHKFLPKWEIRKVPRPVVKYIGEQEIIEVEVPQVKFVDKLIEREIVVDTVQKKVSKITEIPQYVDTVKYVWKPVQKIVELERIVPKFDVALECPAPLIVPYPVQRVKQLKPVLLRQVHKRLEVRELDIISPPGTVRVPEQYVKECTKKPIEGFKCIPLYCGISINDCWARISRKMKENEIVSEIRIDHGTNKNYCRNSFRSKSGRNDTMSSDTLKLRKGSINSGAVISDRIQLISDSIKSDTLRSSKKRNTVTQLRRDSVKSNSVQSDTMKNDIIQCGNDLINSNAVISDTLELRSGSIKVEGLISTTVRSNVTHLPNDSIKNYVENSDEMQHMSDSDKSDVVRSHIIKKNIIERRSDSIKSGEIRRDIIQLRRDSNKSDIVQSDTMGNDMLQRRSDSLNNNGVISYTMQFRNDSIKIDEGSSNTMRNDITQLRSDLFYNNGVIRDKKQSRSNSRSDLTKIDKIGSESDMLEFTIDSNKSDGVISDAMQSRSNTIKSSEISSDVTQFRSDSSKCDAVKEDNIKNDIMKLRSASIENGEVLIQ